MSSEKRLSVNKLRHFKFKVYKERLILLNFNRSLRQQRMFYLMGNNFLLYFKVTKHKFNL